MLCLFPSLEMLFLLFTIFILSATKNYFLSNTKCQTLFFVKKLGLAAAPVAAAEKTDIFLVKCLLIFYV